MSCIRNAEKPAFVVNQLLFLLAVQQPGVGPCTRNIAISERDELETHTGANRGNETN
jgi:hypothetical protein